MNSQDFQAKIIRFVPLFCVTNNLLEGLCSTAFHSKPLKKSVQELSPGTVSFLSLPPFPFGALHKQVKPNALKLDQCCYRSADLACYI